ncbi:MAG TPA: DUF2075 domain-containing protein [Phycisphaerales bacterium]|nr:DUF2075 domain-containing protein [Phycisphaerales bacterium]HMP38402.1 DUF2075 domain-containing protein [Phycisphaerales bacterium]
MKKQAPTSDHRTEALARNGWCSDVPRFVSVPASAITARLHAFVGDASAEQVRAWDESIPPLQLEARRLLDRSGLAAHYTSILEYELPLESRRADMVLLASGSVIVFELKGRRDARQSDVDQAAAYARDLRCYHRCCDELAGGLPVQAVLVPMQARGYIGYRQGVHVAGPDALAEIVARIEAESDRRTGDEREPVRSPLHPETFLAEDAYRPMPTLVKAARELFHHGSLRTIHRARSFTDPAVGAITAIARDAAARRSRRLVLLTGVPGAGKTLVGLRVVHAHFLDDLAVARAGGKPAAPAVFLSGNGPLVEVLQYELRAAGGGGKAFVRGVKEYVKAYSGRRTLVPPEHVIVFDEAQRAWDALRMAEKHSGARARSEPEELIEFAERIPEWCVVIGLVGGGQEIHVGEEAGLGQWAAAVVQSARAAEWTVHCPTSVARQFGDVAGLRIEASDILNLDREIRFHFAQDLHRFVGGILDAEPAGGLRKCADRLEDGSFHLRITRNLDVAKDYLRARYADHPEARYGLLASSKDKCLAEFGIPNGFQDTKRLKIGPWYGDSETDPGGRSCRRLIACVTEFWAQGLELDGALLAWGSDLCMERGDWSIRLARGYKRGAAVRDPRRLRLNAYRVLLTRGRDAVVLYVPPIAQLDETDRYLRDAGFLGID